MIGYIVIICTILLLAMAYKESKDSNEGFLVPPSLPSLGFSFQRRINEIIDTDRVLDRKVVPGKKSISNLILRDSKPETTENCLKLQKCQKNRGMRFHKDDPKEVTCISETHPVRTLIEEKQPYMMDKSEIINYYGSQSYWDWRFPRKPIDIRFAVNPKKYVKEHPNTYPSYVIKSRQWSET